MDYTIHVNGIITYRRKLPPALQGEATGKLLEAWKAAKGISFGRKRRRPTNIIAATIKISLETKDEKIARQRWTVAHTAVETLLSAVEEQDIPVLIALSKDKIKLLGELYKSRRLETDDMQRKVFFNQCVEDEDAIEKQLKTLAMYPFAVGFSS